MGVIFDLDLTIVDSRIAEEYRIKREWNKVYSLIPQMKIYDGIIELINTLQATNINIAIVTSSPRPYCEKILNFFEISNVVTVCYHDTKLHKPNPEPIFKAIELLSENPKNIYSIGDEEKDIIASKCAGVISCFALWGRNSPICEDADYYFNTVEELRKFLLKY